MNFIQKKLSERLASNSFRKLQFTEGKIDFCSNDYLGIATNQLIKIDNKYNHGSKGSRLLAGNYPLIEETEKIIAQFHKAEAALIFNSGYDANIGLLSCIAQREDTILYDQLSHASIRDGIRLSKANSFSFLHNDIIDLEKKLKIASGNIFIITEAVFSMDGDVPPLIDINILCKKYKAHLIVDEAHALGIIGDKGEGLVSHLNLQNDCFARIITFGKACGTHGAAILGSIDLRNYLINFARSFIFTTALPEASIAAIKRSYEIFPSMIEERKHLNTLIQLFHNNFPALKNSCTPIQAVIIPGNENVKIKAQKLQDHLLDIRPILYPTVPKGKERLRIVLHSFNSTSQLEKLFNILNQ